ncbi:aldose epimerase family protein [Cecembia calidifontis]|jgi:aldose 1-epimerase|uniref:Aldose 1-epimerase n=1 Tax=Cecembia calidifontis TaxID=1187080 RepID=A0A4V2F6Z0_9BACT|nr:aldose epimerase family protein [Cecembia calidifontis]RZS97989.1 aldose 1-epimerase [Cecembia calidifontis]
MKKQLSQLLLLLCFLSVISCQKKERNEVKKEIDFDIHVHNIKMGDNQAKVFHLKNGKGMEVELLSYGGILSRIVVPDKDGNFENILLTYDRPEDFFKDTYFFGATTGRYANRIAKGRFELDGKIYELAKNNGENHLHGGREGFNKKFWEAEIMEMDEAVGVKMTYVSPDGEEGYPGNLQTTMTFVLDHDNKLSITMRAETDQPTIVNLTHHGYFNLSGMKEDILGHDLTIHADYYTPVNEGLIPTGELLPVKGTPFDFTSPRKVGESIEETGMGYDHNFVVKKEHDGKLSKMAELVHQPSGRKFTLYSNMPGVQFYSGNFLDGKQVTEGVRYSKNFGLCLEPQFFPDSPNQPHFPSARLNPGEVYEHHIVYEFEVLK